MMTATLSVDPVLPVIVTAPLLGRCGNTVGTLRWAGVLARWTHLGQPFLLTDGFS